MCGTCQHIIAQAPTLTVKKSNGRRKVLLRPKVPPRGGLGRPFGPKGLPKVLCLKDVPETEHDAAVAAIGSPLIEEVRGIDATIRNTEVASVRRVVKLGAKLDLLILSDPRVLKNTDVHIVDAIRSQDIAARIAHALCGGDSLE